MNLGLDHALIAVDDLDAAMRAYDALGFQVIRGGTHPDHGTHNALVPLSDGFYLELMGVWDRTLASKHPHTNQVVQALARHNRLALFALDTEDLDADVKAIRERGQAIGAPVAGERERPDGERVAWRTAHPDDPRLPFLIEDVTPRAARVPEADTGIGTSLSVEAIVVANRDVKRVEAEYARLFGRDPQERSWMLDRGSLRLRAGDADHELQALVLATADVEQLADRWRSRDVAFRDATSEAGRRALTPQPTEGVPLYVVPRSPTELD